MNIFLQRIFGQLIGSLDRFDRWEYIARGVLFVSLFYLFFVVTWHWAVFQKMKRWPEAEGTLITREIVDIKNKSLGRARSYGRFISYFVQESFEVPERKDPVTAYDYSSTSRKKVERIFEDRSTKVPVGTRVPLRLDPLHENQATALLSSSTAFKERASKPALFALISFGVWFLFWKYRLV